MILGSGLIQSANTFTGAYDAIPSIAAAYSTRRLLSSYTGPLLRLVADRTGYPEQDIGYTATGDLDTAAAATFLDGDAGYVTTWYDQSGSYDAAQAVLANMPLYVASGQNSKPVVRGNGTAHYLQNINAYWNNRRTNVSTLLACSISNDTNSTLISCGNDAADAWDWLIGFGSIAGVVAWRNNGDVTFSLSQAWHVLASTSNGTEIIAWVDGTAGTPAPYLGVSGTFDRLTLFSRREGDAHYAGDMGECVVFSAALGTSDRQASETAANAYWSIY